eukprot:765099-Hanusia_phi.AAC.4
MLGPGMPARSYQAEDRACPMPWRTHCDTRPGRTSERTSTSDLHSAPLLRGGSETAQHMMPGLSLKILSVPEDCAATGPRRHAGAGSNGSTWPIFMLFIRYYR